MQLVMPGHEMPANPMSKPEPIDGDATIDQLVPFQRSDNGWSVPDDVLELTPIAMQLVALAHETRSRRANATDAGFGLVTIDQVVPFHCSTKVLNGPTLAAKLSSISGNTSSFTSFALTVKVTFWPAKLASE